MPPHPSPKSRSPLPAFRSAPLRLSKHEQHVTTRDALVELCRELRTEAPSVPLVADLFSGAGGLSYGLESAGMKVVFGVDHYAEANETHAHHFGGMSVDWDLSDSTVVEEVSAIMRDAGITVLAGGPPCQPFSKAGRAGIRHRVREGLRDPVDARRDLWRSYLEVVRLAKPRAVIMENVPDMALDREMFILRSMALDLEHLGYSVFTRIIQTSDYGVPQHRQRLILVALASNLDFNWPDPVRTPVLLRHAIEDLPVVDGGWNIEANKQGFQNYAGPLNSFQREMRARVNQTERSRIYDHVTRPVRDDDRAAFDLMDTTTRYSDLPQELRRYRSDIFDDKYKRLDYDAVSRTITAHIAKDGYWYIHPEQNRTITVREAARIQTFPDHFRFAGTPTAAFKQIGNAVPPRLGQAVGGAVIEALSNPMPGPMTRERVAARLDAWWRMLPEPTSPWLRGTRWQIIMGEMLLDRASPLVIRSLWPVLQQWELPTDTLANLETLQLVASWVHRETVADKLLELAEALIATESDSVTTEALEAAVSSVGLPRSIADLAALAGGSGLSDEEELPVIVNQVIVRVASRFANDLSHARNRNSDGRLAVARMIGFGPPSRNAHVALLELGRSLCSTLEPDCGACPLRDLCAFSQTRGMDSVVDGASPEVQSSVDLGVY